MHTFIQYTIFITISIDYYTYETIPWFVIRIRRKCRVFLTFILDGPDERCPSSHANTSPSRPMCMFIQFLRFNCLIVVGEVNVLELPRERSGSPRNNEPSHDVDDPRWWWLCTLVRSMGKMALSHRKFCRICPKPTRYWETVISAPQMPLLNPAMDFSMGGEGFYFRVFTI